MQSVRLPDGITVLERGWLSANNILLCDDESTTLIDSGYVKHQDQTLALIEQSLQGCALDTLVNTHLHSDHCGGNAALQGKYPHLKTWIPPGSAPNVSSWNEEALSYVATGQNCPRFHFNDLLLPGTQHRWAGIDWEVHAAPGHDPDSVILFAPHHKLLISADALWQNGFGVVFPELKGIGAFDEVSQTLDLIEKMGPEIIIPGHGPVFTDLQSALSLARSKLNAFAMQPERHARYGAKVLLKFKLMEWGSISKSEFSAWAQQVPYMLEIFERFGTGYSLPTWIQMMLDELSRSGALSLEEGVLFDA